MGPGGVVILVLDVTALVGQQDHPRPLVGQLPDGGNAGLNAVDALEGPLLPVHRLVDVHPAEDGFALHAGVVEGLDSKSHSFLLRPLWGRLLFSSERELAASPAAGPSFRANEKKQKVA